MAARPRVAPAAGSPTTMATVSARPTPRRPGASGHCRAPGDGPTGTSRGRSRPPISASSRSSTTPAARERRSSAASLPARSCGPCSPRNPTRDTSVVAMNHPKFLCIGARKAGTTWLWFNLRSHPRVWLTPQKEIHYFDRRPPSLAERLFGRRYHLRAARVHLRQTLVAQWRCWSPDDLRWAARHCLSPRDDAWYRSLFPDDDGLTTGKIFRLRPAVARQDRPSRPSRPRPEGPLSGARPGRGRPGRARAPASRRSTRRLGQRRAGDGRALLRGGFHIHRRLRRPDRSGCRADAHLWPFSRGKGDGGGSQDLGPDRDSDRALRGSGRARAGAPAC